MGVLGLIGAVLGAGALIFSLFVFAMIPTSYDELTGLPEIPVVLDYDFSGFANSSDLFSGDYDDLSGVPVVDLSHCLQGHYGFDVITSALDCSGFRRDGTVSGVSLTGSGGVYSGAYIFDGSNDYVSVNYDLFQGGAAVSVRRDLNTVSCYIVDGWWIDGSLSSVTLALNTWYNIVVVSNLSGTYVWVNDVFELSTSHHWTYDCSFSCWFYSSAVTTADKERLVNRNGATDLRIGYYSSADNAWDGRIDDVRLYNRALTEYDIWALYNLPQ